MHWHVYLRGHVVFVPTTGRLLDEPIYRNMEPVAVVPMSNTEGVRLALAAAIARAAIRRRLATRPVIFRRPFCSNTPA
jgi:hypothetical protein